MGAATRGHRPAHGGRHVDAAYQAPWLWWRDWRETFHSEVDGGVRRELGLVDTSVRGGTEVEEDDEEGDEPVTPPAK